VSCSVISSVLRYTRFHGLPVLDVVPFTLTRDLGLLDLGRSLVLGREHGADIKS
jgi:hypothetical protein